jgi:hypothetical protein
MNTHMLCSPVFIESDSRLFVSGPDASVFRPFSSSILLPVERRGLSLNFRVVPRAVRTDELSRLESAVTENRRVTHLESAVTKWLSFKSFIIPTYEKRRGRGTSVNQLSL